ncbi:hypothetical protein TRFO_11347 [Tritrichomonas foetus]|uniref:Uncharacterized protein n=1 Tax=Tritrichomonas foetus TaxID=1144522 RepID=A0A1J4J401_9EUKA|nr:hypothetical protein TRFO_11347 [Tritrichomonas foetus]|eukprot:OHS94090.1 hypothetical protein TRFO_11347 [Tritrichomonas foetus]
MNDSKNFVTQRYSPIFAQVVDSPADKLMKKCGVSFFELSRAICKKASRPIRIIELEKVQQVKFDALFSKVKQDVTLFSQSFASPEYEERDLTNPSLSPYKGLMPTALHYPSKESMNPPWCQTTFQHLMDAELFQNYNFCDLPLCITYVTAKGQQCLTMKDIKSSLLFPQWMNDFITEIPIFLILLCDNLSNSNNLNQKNQQKTENQQKNENGENNENVQDKENMRVEDYNHNASQKTENINYNNKGFTKVFELHFRTRQENEAGGIDPVDLRNLFDGNKEITTRENLGKFMTDKDLNEFRKVFGEIAAISKDLYMNSMRKLEVENSNNKKLKNVLNRFINKKKTVEKTTSFLKIPWRKVIRMQLAAFYMIECNYIEARHMYKKVDKSIKKLNIPDVKLLHQYMAAMAAIMVDDGEGKYKSGVTIVMNSISAKDMIFSLYVPLVNGEMSVKQGNYQDAIYYFREAIRKINHCWTSVNYEDKSLFLALLNERLAGVIVNQRKSLLATATAAIHYDACSQNAHSLRCLIWIIRALPHDSWQYLYQSATLAKAQILQNLSQWQRSLIDYKELLAKPDLSVMLQHRVITEFWAPFNRAEMVQDKTQVKINSLLEVKDLTLTDYTKPEYWGFRSTVFMELMEAFEKFHRNDKKIRITLDKWFDHGDKKAKKNLGPILVPVGSPVVVNIDFYNRYVFSVNLERVQLCVDFEKVQEIATTTTSHTSNNIRQINPPNNETSTNDTITSDASKNIDIENQLEPKIQSEELKLTEETVDNNMEFAEESNKKSDDDPNADQLTKNEEDNNIINPQSENNEPVTKSFTFETRKKEEKNSNLNENKTIQQKIDDLFVKSGENNSCELKRKKYTNENANFTITTIAKFDIVPGLSTKKMRFKILPLTEGKFTINRFIKNYWGYADTDIECGPLSFITISNKPQLAMAVHDFPEQTALYAITRFVIVIKNIDQKTTVKEFELAFDHNDMIISDTETPEKVGSVSFIKFNKELKAGETLNIPLLFRPSSTATVVSRFLVSIDGTIVSYAVKTAKIQKVLNIHSKTVQKTNDSKNHVVHCTVSGDVDGVRIYGIINQNGKFINSIKTKQKVLKSGQICSIVGFVSDETNTEAEPWRKYYMSEKFNLSLLFQLPDSRIPAQAPITFHPIVVKPTLLNRLRLEIPPVVHVVPGKLYKCRIWLNDTDGVDLEKYYLLVEPKNFVVGNAANGTKEDDVSSIGCRWVGQTKIRLCKENNFSFEFSFVVFRLGIYNVPGFYVTEEGANEKKEVNISQCFQALLVK